MTRQELICWIDTEFSGPDPNCDTLLEVAAIITDMHGIVISDAYHTLLDVPDLPTVIAHADTKVQTMHDASGLWEDLWNCSTKSLPTVEDELCAWLQQFLTTDTICYLGGNTVTLDRNHLATAFPKFYRMLSYRSIDATSLSIFLRVHANGGTQPIYHKTPSHRALPDVYDAITEYQHYVKVQQTLHSTS